MNLNRYDFAFPQGDSVTRWFELIDPSGAPIDCSGYTLELQVRATPQTPTPTLTLDNAAAGGMAFANNDPASGKFSFDITPSQSNSMPLGTFSYAVRVFNTAIPYSWTIAWGYVTILPETAK